MSIFTVTWSIQVNNLLPPVMRATSMQADANGDFVIGSPLPDYIYRIVASSPGHWKEKPSVGVNIWLWLNSNLNADQLKAVILKQLNSDVFSNPFVDVSKFPTVVVNDLVFNPNINANT